MESMKLFILLFITAIVMQGVLPYIVYYAYIAAKRNLKKNSGLLRKIWVIIFYLTGSISFSVIKSHSYLEEEKERLDKLSKEHREKFLEKLDSYEEEE